MSNFILKPGDDVNGQYSVQEVLGQGYFSEVYKVIDLILGRTFALKILKMNETDLEILRAEFNILEELNHPNIVRVHNVGQIPGHNYYMVLDYISGKPLKERIREG